MNESVSDDSLEEDNSPTKLKKILRGLKHGNALVVTGSKIACAISSSFYYIDHKGYSESTTNGFFALACVSESLVNLNKYFPVIDGLKSFPSFESFKKSRKISKAIIISTVILSLASTGLVFSINIMTNRHTIEHYFKLNHDTNFFSDFLMLETPGRFAIAVISSGLSIVTTLSYILFNLPKMFKGSIEFGQQFDDFQKLAEHLKNNYGRIILISGLLIIPGSVCLYLMSSVTAGNMLDQPLLDDKIISYLKKIVYGISPASMFFGRMLPLYNEKIFVDTYRKLVQPEDKGYERCFRIMATLLPSLGIFVLFIASTYSLFFDSVDGDSIKNEYWKLACKILSGYMSVACGFIMSTYNADGSADFCIRAPKEARNFFRNNNRLYVTEEEVVGSNNNNMLIGNNQSADIENLIEKNENQEEQQRIIAQALMNQQINNQANNNPPENNNRMRATGMGRAARFARFFPENQEDQGQELQERNVNRLQN